MTDLAEAAGSGDRLTTLRELRDILARSIDECESLRDLAALTNRFQSVLAEIDELSPAPEKGDIVDEIAKRRSARRSGPGTGQARTQGQG